MELKRLTGSFYIKDGLPKFIQPDELVIKLADKGIRLTQKQILDLVSAQKLPAFFFGDNTSSPFFLWKDVQEWIADNMLWRAEGGPMAVTSIRIGHGSVRAERGIPLELSVLTQLCEISTGPVPVVYFLCHNGSVVYVGQTVSLSHRIKEHAGDKEFDRVFYILVPRHDLDKIERFWITELKPKYNQKVCVVREVVAA